LVRPVADLASQALGLLVTAQGPRRLAEVCPGKPLVEQRGLYRKGIAARAGVRQFTLKQLLGPLELADMQERQAEIGLRVLFPSLVSQLAGQRQGFLENADRARGLTVADVEEAQVGEGRHDAAQVAGLARLGDALLRLLTRIVRGRIPGGARFR